MKHEYKEKKDEKKCIEQLRSNGMFENIEDCSEEAQICHCLCLHSLGFTPEDIQRYVSYHKDKEEDKCNMKALLQSYRNKHLQALHIKKDQLDRINNLLKQLHKKGGV